MKYIDSEKLIAEIERRIEEIKRSIQLGDKKIQKSGGNRLAELELIKTLITSLLQEQPENWNDKCREDEPQTRFAFYTYEDEYGVLYLSNVFVEETSRNKGFGTKILQAAEKVAETIGAITIRLKVKRNSQANDWYRKNGYGYLTFEGEYDWLEKNLEYLKPKQEQLDTCIFGNTPSKSSCKFCGVECALREPKQIGTTSAGLSSKNEAIGLAIMAYLDTKVKHDNAKVCGVSLKIAREWIREKIANKLEQPECVCSEKPNDLLSEWTEEDERTRRNLCSLLTNLRVRKKIEESTFKKYYSWLKIIHIKPRKPRKSKQPEVEFEKEYKSYMQSRKDNLSGNAVTVNMKDLAHHFYELGINARKEE